MWEEGWNTRHEMVFISLMTLNRESSRIRYVTHQQ